MSVFEIQFTERKMRIDIYFINIYCALYIQNNIPYKREEIRTGVDNFPAYNISPSGGCKVPAPST